ncbi:NADH-quinone oxidoreductase subunit D [Leptospira borgpetersenii serovar Hardjo-bovis]|uniref:NADH-quinone oxidoreductase subunit D n=3 Tax=Leptospira TaxID=171 RepID=NUOD_LEPBL|nr:NADH-quinone oxidoreductase subunit D [Leptospira borgpetersenii]Q04YA7.1 RecName: Full=NADH-quinone oxidoreductase subunit D; AltName: Full=NADH dehydrogenase I subunit D; AltName: Full=NDH-1 subunit D [Leptospira borgpetersenii serovar Hardjo-bovis str. L550]ABJ79938.1 NADH dehydrogenase (ubiquinone), D chain [Leptospira borgpetersenii serovar Hardjo-bovis str. L550]AMX59355.1 NADH-quinone oxidoreductase subunit D [Leptospira borgpetersenii serovar Hardjo]AMX62583.1 NADH-quinone oxidoreduc
MMYEKTAEHFEQKYKNLPEGHLLVNLGPSHPATHGILQNVIQIDGERIVEAESVIGYVHRCFEKLGERYTYNQFLVCTDRMNYVSTPLNNIGWILAVEKMMQVEVPDRVTYVRMIISELSRIMDHIICLGILGVDLGAFSGMLHLFHHRENIYQIIEKLTGARLTTTFCRIGGLERDIYPEFEKEVKLVCKGLKPAIEEFNSLLLKNKIFLGRTEGIGGISAENAIAYGFSGPNLRAAGVDWDVRKDKPYMLYDKVDFDVPIGEDGSVLHRSLVRMEEMRQSIRIIEQLVDGIPSGAWHADLPHAYLPEKNKVYNNMEELIYHFKIIMHGVKVPPGEHYMATEAANGELGFYIISEGEKSPWRVHVRRPCFWYYQSFAELVRGGLLADSVATMSSLNVIAGELDC